MTRPPPLQRPRPPSRQSPPATAAPQTSDLDPAEKQLMALGYKPEMHHGEKLFCRRQPVLGSRIDAVVHCGTVAQLKDEIQSARRAADRVQRTEVNPAGH